MYLSAAFTFLKTKKQNKTREYWKKKGNVRNLFRGISIIHQHYSEYSIVNWEYINLVLAQKILNLNIYYTQKKII